MMILLCAPPDSEPGSVTEQNMEASNVDATLGENNTTTTGKGGKGSKEAKPIRYSLPFGEPIFSRPEREWKEEREYTKGAKKGQKTGVVSTLIANVLIPVNGNVLSINTAIYCDTKFDRELGGFVDTYSFSVGKRYTFTIAPEATKVMDAWREEVLAKFDKWLESDASKATAKNANTNMTPRLVKVRPLAAGQQAPSHQ